ncbi:alpha-amylase family glycosyl hydrolase [Thiovibrio sp. JS02]
MAANDESTHAGFARSVQEIDFSSLTADRDYYPSPSAWEDQVLYFLLVDRFSDGREFGGFADGRNRAVHGPATGRTTPPFHLVRDGGRAERNAWFTAGKSWCGGTLAGIMDKLGYLSRLGVTAIWLSPVFRQVAGSQDYHGYGIQNFLDIDPHFGSREELRNLVTEAHGVGIRVILDIILNHAGDVFAYQGNVPYYYFDGRQWPVAGFRLASGDGGTLPFGPVDLAAHPDVWPAGAVWPRELQEESAWSRQGEIRGWDDFPEFLDGDFCSLKDLHHGRGLKDPALAWDVLRRIHAFRTSRTLIDLAAVYKFWIAYADLDGYRLDTVKHMDPGAVRVFTNVIHEFAQSLGKENFYLIGEITGGRAHAVNIVNTTGIDAALGINDIPDKLEFLAKGRRSPGDPRTDEQEGYFDLFHNSLIDSKHTHQWFGRHIITLFDDHDQVGVKHKFRFCGQAEGYRFLRAALGLNLTTAGIPCIYYGTEQGFDGADRRSGDDADYSDVFLRECMFGGPFGSLQSSGRHFFNESHEIYRFMQELCMVRNARQHIALRRGRQYLRQVSASGEEADFHYPRPINDALRWVVAWSRIFAEAEYLCAINTDAERVLTVWVTVDSTINPPGNTLRCLISTNGAQKGSSVAVAAKNGSAVQITVPPAGFVIYG